MVPISFSTWSAGRYRGRYILLCPSGGTGVRSLFRRLGIRDPVRHGPSGEVEIGMSPTFARLSRRLGNRCQSMGPFARIVIRFHGALRGYKGSVGSLFFQIDFHQTHPSSASVVPIVLLFPPP